MVDRSLVSKPFALLAAAVFTLASCSPQIYDFSVEMRSPSSSGLDLTGKSVAIVYPQGMLSLQENKLTSSIVSALADRLDADYPESDSTAVYSIRYTDDYNRKAVLDSLVNLTLRTDADVLFFFCRPKSFESGYKEGYFTMPLYCYDALSGEKRAIRSYTIAGEAGSDPEASGKSMGDKISESFAPQWRRGDFSLWYSSDSAWISAFEEAMDFNWDKAVKQWMGVLENTTNSLDRACLEYNIGLGCYMMGNSSLARQWLEQSNTEYKSDFTTSLLESLP